MASRHLLILASTSCAAMLLAACGNANSARTVETVTQPAATSEQATVPPTTAPTPTTPPANSRTATAPSFTGGSAARAGADGGLAIAVAKLRALGYSPLGTASYNPEQTLRVLVGARTASGARGSAAAHAQQAFFFDGAKFLGTDSQSPSGQIRVAGQSDTAVTLSYGIYRRSDAACCPSAAARSVRFQLDMGKLMALDPIPSVAERR